MSYANSFLQSEEAEGRNSVLKLRNQNKGHSYTYFFFQSKESKSRKTAYIYSFLQCKDSKAKRPYATQILPLILGTQTEEAMKSANSCLVSNEIKPIK